ncbi:type I-E CRISPR-associated protein Cse2/CasB [Quadrisphaera sp. DSM 44207]|uniref:type I-E CRISPR-associated protein Cse2/CasB n=1 Tax=Quadrisphaera sp. DSM 44207 TaxID=1881057 RepID=UPI00088921D5|nr:type I-E CRISPR-associated protein Cse2/CasB [Quadrisphaera sp. DSM 44207]SDQ52583.1 CRISPR-associated protein, Cse2 family [Quadrisphaera sp. DSM 44207]
MSTVRPPAAAGAPPGSRDEQLERYVGARVAALQAGYRADRSAAVGALARLRRAVTTDPGADPAVWAETLAGLPEPLMGRGDEPSAYERAAHSAITVFALHQQSQTTDMHRADQGVGSAVRQLGQRTGADEAVRRRFHALGTASSFAEALHHLRGLVTQFRAAGIPLDYGRLARDLRRLQDPRTADRVRLAWGRDYHRATRPEDLDASTTTGEQ